MRVYAIHWATRRTIAVLRRLLVKLVRNLFNWTTMPTCVYWYDSSHIVTSHSKRANVDSQAAHHTHIHIKTIYWNHSVICCTMSIQHAQPAFAFGLLSISLPTCFARYCRHHRWNPKVWWAFALSFGPRFFRHFVSFNSSVINSSRWISPQLFSSILGIRVKQTCSHLHVPYTWINLLLCVRLWMMLLLPCSGRLSIGKWSKIINWKIIKRVHCVHWYDTSAHRITTKSN